ncbi:WYL domain-containing protein [Scrofimicrobium canadense]|uniref:WYL domain-containing protein n=1 Tax=Scrofimicrobium canadense TaxID=2652290 RepID=UPI00384F1291
MSLRNGAHTLFASTGGRWYLIAWCRLRSAVSWFAIVRVRKAVITMEPYSAHTIQEIGVPPPHAKSIVGLE